MRPVLSLLLCLYAACSLAAADADSLWSLRTAIGDRFLVGVAMNAAQITGADTLGVATIRQHFSSVVAENGMKCEVIHPSRDTYHFATGDSLVAFAEDNGMAVVGHCLIWHSQCAPWFFVEDDGTLVDAPELRRRMKEHITTIMTHYKGRVKGWDVVNEALMEDGSYRQSLFYQILGEEYIPLAFEYAHAADPAAELYYNDYAMNMPAKRAAVLRLLVDLQQRGLRVDAVGMQGHMGLDYPEIDDVEESIVAFAATGVKVMITEWDMSALPTIHQGADIADIIAAGADADLYPEALPADIAALWNERMAAFLRLFLKHSASISRVTAWGLSDGDSWKNDYPIRGRHDYPLLFDRTYAPKPFLRTVCADE